MKVQKVARLRVDDILEQISAYEIAMDYDDQDITDFIRYLSRFGNELIDAYFQLFEALVGVMYTTPEGFSELFSRRFSFDRGFFSAREEGAG